MHAHQTCGQARLRDPRQGRRRRGRLHESTSETSMPTHLSPRQQAGHLREQQALALLQRHGLRHLASNFRCKGGEIDLIMADGAQLVFVEVRHRSSSAFGGARSSVGPDKQRRLVCAAHSYLATLKRVPSCRFDLVAIEGETLSWLKNVIEL